MFTRKPMATSTVVGLISTTRRFYNAQFALRSSSNLNEILSDIHVKKDSEPKPIKAQVVEVENKKQLTLDNMNQNIRSMNYAVLGPLVTRAMEIEKELQRGIKKPFSNVIGANIGDAHAMGQSPITFIRQVLACCTLPTLLNEADFPSDVKERAKKLLAAFGGSSIGSYSASVGVELIRNHVAEFIEKRDGFRSNPDEIVLSGGASETIRGFMKLFANCQSPNGKPTGFMIPIPQYPVYSATITEFGMHQIGYYLNEENNWSLDASELKRAINAARSWCNPRCLCVINPGNPTGNVFSRQNIEEIVKFAKEEGLFLFADEVYQENVYDPKRQFHSFKKVISEMGAPYSRMELISFHSASKGYVGECGMRGGYAEIVNVDPEVLAQFQKSNSAKICPTVTGQIVLDCVMKPPKPGDPSYPLFAEETALILKSLSDKAKMVFEAFNSIKGVECNSVQGALYAHPRVFLPKKAVEKANSLGQAPDFFYAMQLLENTGICVVPGSGFGQREGTYHFRTTILPSPALFKDMLQRFKKFHLKFLADYS